MAVPALLGLPALGALLGKLFEKSIDFLFSRIGKRIAVISTVIASLFLAITTLFNMLPSSLLSGLPSEVTSVLGAALPSNTVTCLTAILTTELACIAYKLTVKALEIQTKVVA